MVKSARTYDKAARLFLSGEMDTTKQIAAAVKIDPHTVERWRREGDWDALKRGIPIRAAAMLRQRLAGTQPQRDAQHRQMWGLMLIQAGALLARPEVTHDELEQLERVVAASGRCLAMIRGTNTQAA